MTPPTPDMWRIELLHPLTVHFPIALLIVGSLLELVSGVLRGERREFTRAASLLLLILGSVAAWISVLSGGEAEEIVEKMICNHGLLEDHEGLATTVSGIFTGVTVLAVMRRLRPALRMLTPLIVLGSIGGSALLGYVGHLGATLVYQQGAAVYRPSADCHEFPQAKESH